MFQAAWPHNYTVEVQLTSSVLDQRGFVADFGELDPVKGFLADTWDHAHLNDSMPQPSCENLARVLYDWCAANLTNVVAGLLHGVRVAETPSTWAEYRPTSGRP